MVKNMTCIVCPNGCSLTVTIDKDNISVTGNTCKRGEAFGTSEVTHPMRTICSTVATTFKDKPVLPVRVSKDIPKGMIFKVMEEINKVRLDKKVGRGYKVIENVLGLGVDVIVTSDILLED